MPSPLFDKLIILHFDATSSRLSGIARTSGLRLRFGHTIDPLPLDSDRERTWMDYANLLALAADRYCIAAFELPTLIERLRAPGVRFACCLPLPGVGTLADAEVVLGNLSKSEVERLRYSEREGPTGVVAPTGDPQQGLSAARIAQLDSIGGVLSAARPLPRIMELAAKASEVADIPPPTESEITAYRKLVLSRMRASREVGRQLSA